MPKKVRIEPIKNLISRIDDLYSKASKRPWVYDGDYEMFIGSRHVVRRSGGNLMFGITGPRRWDSTGKILEDDKLDAAEAELTALLHNSWPRLRKLLLKR